MKKPPLQRLVHSARSSIRRLTGIIINPTRFVNQDGCDDLIVTEGRYMLNNRIYSSSDTRLTPDMSDVEKLGSEGVKWQK